ncbi:MAG: polymer-forming cytoskeletal protein [Phycisphaeraceae bacterium]|jgi:cytoskeletal protein CcmA (bactofilin family)|nr:polymer-forming cytoskeletal protein [Phycisphaeraceae bacterium]
MAEQAHTIIGPDTHIKGDMTFESTARLLGSFEGRIAAKGELQIADSAVCKAAVEAGKVTIDGQVEGNVTARDRVELSAKARMKGDLIATKLVVVDGASFVGHVTVGPDAAKAAKPMELEIKPMAAAQPPKVETKPQDPARR